MAMKIALSKDKTEVKIGILGFSWVTFFFGLWVPFVRRDWKIWLPLFAIWVAAMYASFYLISQTYTQIDNSVSIQFTDTIGVSQWISGIFWFFYNFIGAFVYNKIYTKGLVKRKYFPLSSEGAAILKQFGIKLPVEYYEQDM